MKENPLDCEYQSLYIHFLIAAPLPPSLVFARCIRLNLEHLCGEQAGYDDHAPFLTLDRDMGRASVMAL